MQADAERLGYVSGCRAGPVEVDHGLKIYILHLLAMAGFLVICGVPREEIAKWALKQAGRQRLTGLIRAARGKLPPGDT